MVLFLQFLSHRNAPFWGEFIKSNLIHRMRPPTAAESPSTSDIKKANFDGLVGARIPQFNNNKSPWEIYVYIYIYIRKWCPHEMHTIYKCNTRMACTYPLRMKQISQTFYVAKWNEHYIYVHIYAVGLNNKDWLISHLIKALASIDTHITYVMKLRWPPLILRMSNYTDIKQRMWLLFAYLLYLLGNCNSGTRWLITLTNSTWQLG